MHHDSLVCDMPHSYVCVACAPGSQTAKRERHESRVRLVEILKVSPLSITVCKITIKLTFELLF